MKHTLDCLEKMDKLLDETEEYIKCANHAEDNDIKSAYQSLARCHYDGYENLRRCADRMIDKKAHSLPEGTMIKEMALWHLDKYDERAHKTKTRLDMMS